MKKAILGFLLSSFFASGNTVLAAQVGEVVVDRAQVYQYPQATSKVVGTLQRGETIAVSNLATEGFYKARLANGETGWLSGNDIHAGAKPAPKKAVREIAPPESSLAQPPIPVENAAPAPATNNRMKRKPPQKRMSNEGDEESEEDTRPAGDGDQTRILFGLGMQNLAYSGLAANFEKVDALNPGLNVGLEFQFRIASWFHWAARVDAFMAKASDQSLSNGSNQNLQATIIPAQLGLIITPIDTQKFRMSFGAYLGASFSTVSIQQTSTTLLEDVSYKTVDPCALGSVQMAYALGRHFALFGEGGYRYEQTADLPATNKFGGIPSFKINTTGALARAGFELRF